MAILGPIQLRPSQYAAYVFALVLLVAWPSVGFAADENVESSSVIDMSLEDLLNVEITSVSKRSEKRTAAAAAIYVLTQEDIRRSGANSVPDLLRTVPGIHVAQHDANKWSVTSRGFSGRFANMLLVLIDGRTIYTPFFSGVYWESNDVVLEDVERIEIIRGPGGTLWGANAVNGVINIVTKKAVDTQGGLLSVGGGSEDRASGVLRYGGEVGDLGHWRAHAKYFYRDEGGSFVEDGFGPSGGNANDDWHNGHVGFRMDLDLSPDDALMIQGGIQAVGTNGTYDLPFYVDPMIRRTEVDGEFQDYFLMGQWTRRFADESEIQLQGYWNYYHAEDVTLDEQRHTIDLDFQHRFQAGTRHDILWGVGYRVTTDDFDDTEFTMMDPERRTDHLISAFIQDEISINDELKLTLGTKIEHNDYTGFEIQPAVRMAWTPNDKHTLWAAISRAVRTPSRSEEDIRLNYGPAQQTAGVSLAAFSDSSLDATELLAFELGYRTTISEKLALDIALFYNDYDNVRTVEIGTPFVETDPPPTHTILPVLITSGGSAETWGFEIGADVTPKPWWLIRGAYSYIHVTTSNVFASTGAEEVPQNMFSLQNRFDLPHNVELGATLRYVDEVEELDIDNYVELDARIAWRPREDLEIALVGRNLLDSQHAEYDDLVTLSVPTEVQRGVYGKITWRF